ncbi:sugar phosphate isomerase/epimerase family protein [Candidatus Riflebacteria bacterium]
MDKCTDILDKVSYHAVYTSSIMEALRFAQANGFAGIRLAVESPHLSFERLTEEDIEEIAEFLKLHKLYISIHTPDEATSLFQCSSYLKEGIINYFRGVFTFARRVNAKIITVHAGKRTEFLTAIEPVRRIPTEDVAIYEKEFRDNLELLLEISGGEFILCIENYGFDAQLQTLLQPYLQRQDIFLCWDLAKSYAKPDQEDFILANLESVRQVHLHDVGFDRCGNRRSHLLPGTGAIDFNHYFTMLSKSRVLDYCIEVRPAEKARESLVVLNNMLKNLFI